MPKNSIGQFIAILRKSKGMTQQEVADRLGVSNKSVSRWERDECAPDLSLIPAIAEMFDITCDELLRGEKTNSDKIQDRDIQKNKSTKQFKIMLHNRRIKYKNLSLISLGITIFGLIAAVISNLAFSEGLIAFCLAAVFALASEICQICFASNARLMIDEDEEAYTKKIQKNNTSVVNTAVIITFINISAIAFCLPLITLIDGANYGISIDTWCFNGIITSIAAFIIAYIVYNLLIRKLLIKNSILVLEEEQTKRIILDRALLIKTSIITSAVAILLFIGILILNITGIDSFVSGDVVHTPEQFKKYMENVYDRWYNEGYLDDLSIGVIIKDPDLDKDFTYEDYPMMEKGELRDKDGNLLCNYYYAPHLIHEIIYDQNTKTGLPATIITKDMWYFAADYFYDIESTLYALVAIDLIAGAGFYLIKILVKKKTKSTN